MPARKSSPSKGKKSPRKARSTSRSRSRSTSKSRAKKTTRSRSRSASRTTVVSEVKSKSPSRAKAGPGRPPKVSASPARPAKVSASPARPPKADPSPSIAATVAAIPPLQVSKPSPARQIPREEPILPTRVSRRIIERTSTYQDGDFVSHVGLNQFVASNENVAEQSVCYTPLYTTDANNNATANIAVVNANVVQRKVTKDGQTKSVTSSSVTTESSSEGGLGYGGIIMVLFLVLVTYLVALSCDKTSCSLLKFPKCPAKWQTFFSLEVVAFLIAFHSAFILLALVPIGSVVQGQPLRDGQRLGYRCNAWFSLLAAAAAFGYAVQTGFPVKMNYVHEHFLHFVTADVILCLELAIILFIWGRNAPANERSPAADGTFWNDFCMGRVLNPRIGEVDIKNNMCRASMIAWLAIDWMYLLDRFKTNQTVELALVAVVLFHTLYILFNIRNEATWLSTNDFMKEGAGFVLTWATMCLIPYAFSLQTRFLYLYPKEGVTNQYALGAIFFLNAVGLMFFIGANWQKNEFRKNPYNPDLAHLSSIPTATGKRLLCSGWWGIVRRPNYLGDLIMAVAWGLPCGFNYGIPYVYLVYLVALLVGRVVSDEKSCHKRYGDAWVKYTEVVRYRLIPYVF